MTNEVKEEVKDATKVTKKVAKKVTITDAYLKLKALPKMTIEKFETIEEIQTLINVCNQVIKEKIQKEVLDAEKKYNELKALQIKLNQNA